MGNTCEHGLKKSECYVCISPRKGARMSDVLKHEKTLKQQLAKAQAQIRHLTACVDNQERRAKNAEAQLDGARKLNADLNIRLKEHLDQRDRERCVADKEWRDEMLQDQGLKTDDDQQD